MVAHLNGEVKPHINGINLKDKAIDLLENSWVHPVAIYPPGIVRTGKKTTEGKEPIDPGWGLVRATAGQLSDRFRRQPAAGIGMTIGPGKGPDGKWIADFEGDGEGADVSLMQLLNTECMLTTSWLSARGSHNVFIVDGERLLNLLLAAGAVERKDAPGVFKLAALPGLEIRVGGFKDDGVVKQVQSVIPPTIGTDGRPREWQLGPEAIVELPEAAYTFLEMMGKRKAAQDARAPLNGNGALPGKPLAPVTGLTIPSIDDHSDQKAWFAAALQGEADDVASTPMGSRRNRLRDAAFNLGGQIHHGYLTEAEIVHGLMDAGLSCKLSHAEVAETVRDGVTDGQGKPLSWPKKLARPGEAKPPTSASAAYTARVRAEMDEEKRFDDLLEDYEGQTFGVISGKIGSLVHLWKNWLIVAGITMICSLPKIGKTRLVIGLIKCLWFGTKFPDGAENTWGAGIQTLYLPYDNNHLEIADAMKDAGIPDEAVICPSDPRDETGAKLMSLTDPLMPRLLEKILARRKHIKLMVIDTLTYASEKSLCKAEDMKSMLDPIMTVALQHALCIIVLIHKNAQGTALGRRIEDRARVLCYLERYNEADNKRLRLFVKESNFKERPAVTVVHGDKEVSFEMDKGEVGHIADKRDECARWLVDYLWKKGEVEFGPLMDAVGNAGYAGAFNPTENRYSDRKLFGRVVNAINDKVSALADLHAHEVKREERTIVGRSKPVIVYSLETDLTWPTT